MEKLPDKIKELGEGIEFPIITLRGEDEDVMRVISGIAACSEDVLIYSLKDSMRNPPQGFDEYEFRKIKSESKEVE